MSDGEIQPAPAVKPRGVVGLIGLIYSAATLLTLGLLVLLKPG